MNKFKSLGLVGLAAASLFAAQAFATTCPVGTMGSPVCVATTGGDPGPTSLEDILSLRTASNPNGIVKSGPNINPYTQQTSPSSYWSIGATGSSENVISLEIAGNANGNTFGIFDPANSNNTLQLFSGPASTGWSTTLKNLGGGQYKATYFNAAGDFLLQNSATFGPTNLFGYYLATPGGTFFFSNAGMNAAGGTTYPGGMPQMVAFQGNNQTSLYTGNTSGLFLANEYLLAWEDQAFVNSDLDYNDFVVLVESVHPVPEPAALGMFGLGALLIGLFAGLRRRRENV